jgi:2-iminobutanoate/2-iminopropanoate deaminase
MRGPYVNPLLRGFAILGNEASPPRFFPAPPLGGLSLPFSDAVQVGSVLLVSDQIGKLPGQLDVVRGGLVAEARQALENIKAIAERHGSSLRYVVKCKVFLADMREWGAFNEVYRRCFSHELPARSAFGASRLVLGARAEVEGVAHVPAAPA